MTVAIIDYGSGNLRSVAKAFERIADDASPVLVTSNPEEVASSSRIVLPGVGAFGDCMRGLQSLPGMLLMLQEQVLARKKPLLGICVGMQMLFERGHEHGVHEGLGWLTGEVIALGARDEPRGTSTEDESSPTTQTSPPRPSSLKIPHMGWNELKIERAHPLLDGIRSGDHAYFVHSYHARCQPSDLLASVDYGQTVAAVVGQGNIMGTQFHPEKSQETGLRILKNFVSL